jgi:hypothetical protein
MKTNILKIIVLSVVLFTACKKSGSGIAPANVSDDMGNNSGIENNNAGVMTAAEWCDLNNWSFWNDVSSKSEYAKFLSNWSMNTKNRISLSIFDSLNQPVKDALVQLKKSGSLVFTAKTDAKGKAELWANLFGNDLISDYSAYQININNGAKIISEVKPYFQGTNNVILSSNDSPQNKIEISFVVDATSSMGDELKYLKAELTDVIARVKNNNANSEVLTSSVFYRDEKDDYVTKVSDFTSDASTTINFIKDQEAEGGGDNPEAVHTALEKAIGGLAWTSSAKTRILFLILDAPPHFTPAVLSSLQTSIAKANEMGIKVIPIAASGVDKETEFLMRSFAISTNATYVFITNDSGIGKDHMAATVGSYQVEYLNNLMVRLINSYSK